MRKEILEKAKKARSAEDLMAMANAAGIELEKSKADGLFARLSKCGEISDDDLCGVAGGVAGDFSEQDYQDLLDKMDRVPVPGEFKNTEGGGCVSNIKA